MKIDWDKLKVVESRDVKKSKHGISEYKKSVKELRKELRDRGLKYTGTKEELLDRIKKDGLTLTSRKQGHCKLLPVLCNGSYSDSKCRLSDPQKGIKDDRLE